MITWKCLCKNVNIAFLDDCDQIKFGLVDQKRTIKRYGICNQCGKTFEFSFAAEPISLETLENLKELSLL